MKVLFFSDVHGSPGHVALLEQQLGSIRPDRLVLLGDVLYHGPRNPLLPDYGPPEVAAMLNSHRRLIFAVRGNCDSEVDQLMLEFPILADYAGLLVDNRQFFLTHGHLWGPDRLPPLEAGTVFASGHTHIPMLRKLPDGVIAFNPGSISLPKGGFPPSFGLYEDGVLRVLALEDARELLRLELS